VKFKGGREWELQHSTFREEFFFTLIGIIGALI
jgi:hypothetical protein